MLKYVKQVNVSFAAWADINVDQKQSVIIISNMQLIIEPLI